MVSRQRLRRVVSQCSPSTFHSHVRVPQERAIDEEEPAISERATKLLHFDLVVKEVHALAAHVQTFAPDLSSVILTTTYAKPLFVPPMSPMVMHCAY